MNPINNNKSGASHSIVPEDLSKNNNNNSTITTLQKNIFSPEKSSSLILFNADVISTDSDESASETTLTNEDITSILETISDLKSVLQKPNKSRSSQIELQNTILNKQQTILSYQKKQLAREVKNLTSHLKDEEQKKIDIITSSEKQISELTKKNEDLKNSVEEYTKNINFINDKMRQIENELINSKQTVSLTEIENLRQANKKLLEEKNNLESIKQNLEDQLHSSESTIELQKINTALKTEREALQAINTKLEKEIKFKDQEIKKWKLKKNNSISNLNLPVKKHNLRFGSKVLEPRINPLNELKKYKDLFLNQKQQLEVLERELTDLKNVNKEIQKENESITSEYKKIYDKSILSDKKIETLTAENLNLNQQIATMQIKLKRKYSEVNPNNNQKENEIKRLKLTIEKCLNDLAIEVEKPD